CSVLFPQPLLYTLFPYTTLFRSVMDGHFVPNITIGPLIVDAIEPGTELPLDVHLMIENPDQYIETFAKSGASIISVHQEACTHLDRKSTRLNSSHVSISYAVFCL